MVFLWVPIGFIWVLRCWSVLSCVVIVVQSCVLFYIIGILHGSSRIPIGLLWDSNLVDDDDYAAVAVDVADAVSDDADDDDDNGHDGDDHQCHPQVIHIT